MLQQDYLFPWKTIEENILLGLKLKKLLNKEKRDYTLNLLWENGVKRGRKQYPKQLSGGMRQRVALVRTLATEPKLLMLDEPFSALDYQTKLHLENLVFETLKSFHKTAILVTHDIGEAIAMSDRIFLLSAKPGRFIKRFSFQKNYETSHHLKQETMNYFKPYFKRYGRSWNLLKPSDNITQLHQQYISSQKREKRWVCFYQLILFIVFFSSWELASQQKWIDSLIFSSPTRIGSLLIDKILDGTLFINLSITLSETILGFILGTLIGTLLAAILWWSSFLSKVLDPYLVILNAMPKIALGPILIVAIGPNFTSIMAMGAMISIIITTIVIYTAFREVDPNYLKVLQTFGATRLQSFKEVILPASFPTIISTLKVNVGLSWVGVIVGEFLVSSKGLGYMIIYGFQVFNFTLVFLALLVIAIFATIMYQLVDLLEKKLIKNGS